MVVKVNTIEQRGKFISLLIEDDVTEFLKLTVNIFVFYLQKSNGLKLD
jgi:hypothetical protein